MFQLSSSSSAGITGALPFAPPVIPADYVQKWPVRLDESKAQAQITPLISFRLESWPGSAAILHITGCVYLMCDGWNGTDLWLDESGAHLEMGRGLHYAQFIDSDNNNYEAYCNCVIAPDGSSNVMIEAAIFQVEQLAPLQPLYPLHIKI